MLATPSLKVKSWQSGELRSDSEIDFDFRSDHVAQKIGWLDQRKRERTHVGAVARIIVDPNLQ